MNDLNASAEANVMKIENNYNGNVSTFDKVLACLCPERFEQAKDIDIEYERKRLQEITQFLSQNPDVAEFSQAGTIIKREVMSPQIKREMERMASDALRLNVRKMIQEQINLEKIALNALEENSADTRPNRPIDDDWLNVFQENAKNCSKENAQKRWGKILAGELKHPGAFSLRTLTLLRGLSQDEAFAFELLCRYAIDREFFSYRYLSDKNIIAVGDLLELNSIGVVDLRFGLSKIVKSANKTMSLSSSVAGKIIMFESDNALDFSLAEIGTFTKCGKELASLVNCASPPELDYFRHLKQIIRTKKPVSVFYVDGLPVENNKTSYTKEKKIQL